MKLANHTSRPDARRESGSVFIIVLWICIGLVSIALYFANSMTYELRAADNRVSGLEAEQAIEGAARYVKYALSTFATNGVVPDNTEFSCEAVPVGDAKFWIIGRDPSGTASTAPYFGLVDEGSKLNLNRVGTNALSYLPNMTSEFAQAIMDWRSTNGMVSLDYARLGYIAKQAHFETMDELRLVDGATMDLLAGEDINRNGVLDANEKDVNGDGQLDSGLFEYVTVYSREPNFHSDGTTLTNVNLPSRQTLQAMFRNAGINNPNRTSRDVYNSMHPSPNRVNPCASILDFYLRCQSAGMSASDFAKIYDNISTTGETNRFITGRLNINTASVPVLTALFMSSGIDEPSALGAAQSLAAYRDQNRDYISSVTWIVDALGSTHQVVQAMKSRDVITTRSFQFKADIAAVGPFGRGYRRVKFIFDVSEATPIILFRQDLGRLGWALGAKARETWVAKETP
jgi:type II secretory pathway component PulK